ncbi:MAG: hypothetical protein KA149_01320 [Chitinophagales bacterium]|nr:hypothetical protein [Chitinophagales bacterium]
MYRISDRQIDYILNDISARGVKLEDLQYNLLDHVCCIIEQNLEEGGDFEAFYAATIQTFYNIELKEVQDETIQLLTFKNYYAMKKIMLISGAVSVALLTMGIVLKFMHAAGASFGLVAGIAVFTLIFLPLLFTLKVKETQTFKDKLVIAIGAISGALISLGILFKVMHWPGANVQLLVGILSFSIVFLPLAFLLKVKDTANLNYRLLFSLGGLVMSISILFKILHWPGADILGITAIPITGLLFLPIYFVSGVRNLHTRLNTIITSVIIVVGCGLLLSLVRVPGTTTPQTVADMHRYIQNEQLLHTEYKQIEAIATKTPANLLGQQIYGNCEELKSYLLQEETGHKTIDAGFESKNTALNDAPIDGYFSAESAMGKKLQTLRSQLTEYNKTNIIPNSPGTPAIPVTDIVPAGADNRLIPTLNDFVRIQMFVLQNERALASQ